MLRIKESVDLKELEKFGFIENEKFKGTYKKKFQICKNGSNICICVGYGRNLFIQSDGYIKGEHHRTSEDGNSFGFEGIDYDYALDMLFDLINANLVERVPDEIAKVYYNGYGDDEDDDDYDY